MPELPEVETVTRGLCHLVYGEDRKNDSSNQGENLPTIRNIEVRNYNLRIPVPQSVFSVVGAQILNIHRRAKFILIETSQGSLINHLGMTGKWRLKMGPEIKHDHLLLHLDNNISLIYNDVRRFGFIDYAKELSELQNPWLRHLGPEPLDSHEFNAHYLQKICHKKTSAIKTLLMNQKVVVGIGNIYASEILFRSGISPLRHGGQIKKDEIKKLVLASRSILKAAIKKGGTTIRDFKSAEGEGGYFATKLKVYGRVGLPCPVCAQPICKVVLVGRSTFYCKNCQK